MKLPSKLTKKHAIAGVIILALAFGFGGWKIFANGTEETGGTDETGGGEEVESPVFRHPLSGLQVSEDLSILPRVYAVMIDNSVDAWPPSGVDRAFLVIEAPVEASIPRFEAFFSADTDVEKIGPVRSARPYFIDWANEFDALYAHVGGSNAALDLIASTGTFDLNEFYNGVFFWRSSDRYAPHNTYTSTALLAAAVAKAEERGRAPETLYGTWKFIDDEKSEDGEKKGVTVQYNSALYSVHWEYDAETNAYLRSQGGREAKTADGTRLTANNIVVMVTDVAVLDSVGRRSVRTTGEGKAWLLQDGKTIEITWKKPSVSERLAFYDADGNQVAMGAGNTWIEVIPSEKDVSIN
ncbi:hypothetical protein A2348_05470 [Candidatus Uhrbacteria bacterium RIFOXYB12_FULL_58_10]|uniref:DUF3048 domain-containing protein n=1 Tax=Candidatus Uhrbacteria bacterium RIFOXYB2_FULL_57_15 TaxID=1802422 RepID=A0A1F7W7X0_9BACT|nr:MAG: hypothetical protein A2348_05470 [Candidatus Uhrbacteria bacterium RIFOXYB12_FULL_58_10]OGL98891.1 MAG: hypothetical protein A2304_04025 [Candidatus Uhrbacteria bacterium RIFOXYB2_FULL_57_15]OGM00348.1 MAG: hypothetical protein A2501_02135 [Candidatus Uhrbacteria bacterium RIFOXYC12_FULL_57_11]